jgi:hypothetical protein
MQRTLFWRKEMRKLGILSMVVVVLFIAPAVSQAQEQAKKLGVSLDLTYVSKWVFNGVEVWSEDGGFYETIALDLWKTGFKTSVTHRSAVGSGNLDKGGNANRQRLDYTLAYGGSAFDDTPYAAKYTFSYMYKNWYSKLADAAGKSKDCETWTLKYSLPNLLGSTGLVPYGITNYTEPTHSDDGWGAHWSGAVHRLGLGYDLDVPDLPSPLHLTSDIAYTDGFCAADHDWSFATCGISTKLNLSDNITFAPAIYYQISMDDSVCDHDITYCALSLKYVF